MSPLYQPFLNVPYPSGIQHVCRGNRAFARDTHSICHVAKPFGVVSIRIDARQQPLSVSRAQMAPVEVEAVRIGI